LCQKKTKGIVIHWLKQSPAISPQRGSIGWSINGMLPSLSTGTNLNSPYASNQNNSECVSSEQTT
jgi:hypothetical protein